jgi:single-strand DNA-binding protein
MKGATTLARKHTQQAVELEQEMVTEERPGSERPSYRPRTDTNLVVQTGRLGADPELRYVGANGAPVAEFRIAVGRSIGAGEEQRASTSSLTVKCWNRLAEVVAEHLHAGRKVLVTGRLEEERWQDRETGQNRSRVAVAAERVEFLDGPRTDVTLEGELPFEAAA